MNAGYRIFMKVDGHIWIESLNGFQLGKGRVILLQQIAQSGSITQASKNMNISYRKAWGMVREMNKTSQAPVVQKYIGGKKGGGAYLTKEGEKYIQTYNSLVSEFEKFKEDFVVKFKLKNE